MHCQLDYTKCNRIRSKVHLEDPEGNNYHPWAGNYYHPWAGIVYSCTLGKEPKRVGHSAIPSVPPVRAKGKGSATVADGRISPKNDKTGWMGSGRVSMTDFAGHLAPAPATQEESDYSVEGGLPDILRKLLHRKD